LVSKLLSSSPIECDPSDKPKETKYYRRSEVAQHTSIESGGVWVTYKDGVYDVTSFVANHPGGTDKLMLAAGKDLTELWRLPAYQLHFQSPLAFELLEEMRIGTLYDEEIISLDISQLEKNSLKYSPKRIYDCIVLGAGISGLQCAKSLTKDHKIASEDILVLEAQSYIGGRVRQVSDFVKGVHIDVGAEFLHGTNTLLTKFAEENNQPISEIFCWVHGDGGPLQEPASNGGYGLYYLGVSRVQ
jgi:cytochrome b involved in lipid metabolism